MTTRDQVEAALRAAGFTEEAAGDWVNMDRSIMVLLSIRHAPGTAWIVRILGGWLGRKLEITYDEVVRYL